MEQIALTNIPLGAHLLLGCCREADRANDVARSLDHLRAALPESFHSHLIALAEEIRASSGLLRSLADRSQMHMTRVPFMTNYLSVLLPCLSRTLQDITKYYDDKTLTRETRWRKMYNNMTGEAGGLPLPQRFVLYNHFLSLLKLLLARSPDFDLNTLETLRTRVVTLRERRGIPPPAVQPGALVQQSLMSLAVVQDQNSHWAEQIFSLPLPSRTPLKHLRLSKSFGPFQPSGQLSPPPGSKILFKRTFDNDTISLTAYLSSADQCPYFLARTRQGSAQWYSLRGAHELCIEREGSALQLKRWSHTDQCSKLWVVMYFLTWEEMVLFHCTFVALKARNPQTVQIHPAEFQLHREKRLFQAQITDDAFKHSLIVYEDMQSQGLRLHAAVWDGELRQCPVWTAFITYQSRAPRWLSQRGRHRVWLNDVQLYVFCSTYRQENMRQNKSAAFEICFNNEEAAKRFVELFSVRSANSEASENGSAPGPST